MSRVLLFGASGFIGSQVEAALLADPRTTELVRAGRRFAHGTPGWVRHDLIVDGGDQLAAMVREVRPDVVVNCTGRLGGTAEELVQANVLVTARLIDAIAVAGPAARLVTLGSAGEYGVVPYGQPVSETAPEAPTSLYGVTKLAGTNLVRVAVRDGRVNAVVLRTFNPIGPGVPSQSVLGRAAANIRAAVAAGRDHIRLGPLSAYRDFVDVRDVASAVVAAAFVAEVPESVLNVGSGVAVTTRAAVSMLVAHSGFAGGVVESDAAPARSAAVDWIAADTVKIGQSLGWSPRYDLRGSVLASWDA